MGKNRRPEDWARWEHYQRTGQWPTNPNSSGEQFKPKDNPPPTGGVKPKSPKSPKKPATPKGGAEAKVEQPTLFDFPELEKPPVNPYYFNH